VENIITTRNLQRWITAGAIAMALQCTAAMGQTGLTDLVKVPPVPPGIEVPAGNRAFLKGSAGGTQNYICLSSGWTFLGPQATLFFTYQWFNGEIRQQITTHFLSPNPMEGGTPRPTWQSSLDTSAVWGKAIANSSDSNYVRPGAIPWLLVEAVGAQRGPSGGTSLSQTTFIQRVNTSGGVAPSTGCSASSVGSVALVPYTTDYYFYQAVK
jgi:hypothetical protein